MLTTKQVAKKMNVSERTINRWTKSKVIPYYLFNGIIRYNEAVIDSWIDKRRVRTKQSV